ncbi:MAG: 30S ribosomal protein S13 [Candidatus Lokiarchaeota archaeon]|nr:30S ribosomal protein S13 [Candidatus Lokiarchaeota archaeon]
MTDNYRHIIRIAGTDLDGSRKIGYALTKIRGIGIKFSYAILRIAEIDHDTRLGFLSDRDIKKIEDIIKNPQNYPIPNFMMNRRKDMKYGYDTQLTGSDLILVHKSDIDRMRSIKSYKGIRHAQGLKVRGQRTRSTGRSGGVVGVSRKKLIKKMKSKNK